MIAGNKFQFSREDLYNFYNMIDDEDLSKYEVLRAQKEREIKESANTVFDKILKDSKI